VTAFTVGHSITLALAITGALEVRSSLIEFLIPVTIVITGSDSTSASKLDSSSCSPRQACLSR